MHKWLAFGCLFCVAARAGVVEDVRAAIGRNDFPAAEKSLAAHRALEGNSPQVIEAVSWLGRGALALRQWDRAESYANQAYRLANTELTRRALDAEPRLPIALGAAIEVQAQSMAGRGQRDQAVAYLRAEVQKYGATSIRPRIQKNINLLSLEGKPAPALAASTFAGPARAGSLVSLRGRPVLLFFWAHWCGDCKGMAPAIERLLAEYGARVHFVAPTKLYGYVAGGEEAGAAEEARYIAETWRRFYGPLSGVPAPIENRAVDVYGCSTTPTLVLVDRGGVVRLYHPGAMTYDELKPAIDAVLTR